MGWGLGRGRREGFSHSKGGTSRKRARSKGALSLACLCWVTSDMGETDTCFFFFLKAIITPCEEGPELIQVASLPRPLSQL